jgi:Fe-S-cluster containining protein
VGYPIIIDEDGCAYIAMSPDDFIRSFAATDTARERYTSDIAEVERLLDDHCKHCGMCCSQTEHMDLHEYEAPRIAYLLRKHFGIRAVMEHVFYRPVPFNRFTEYIFAFKDKCPFFIENHCVIEEDRPLVCKLYPLFLELFVDREDPHMRQEIVCAVSFHKNAPCAHKCKQIDTILRARESGDLIRAVVWDRIADRREDIAHLFARPSEEAGSIRHIDPSGLTGEVFAKLSLMVFQRYNEILGHEPHIYGAPETLGTVQLEYNQAEELYSMAAIEDARVRAEVAIDEMVYDYSQLILKSFEEQRRSFSNSSRIGLIGQLQVLQGH